MDHWGNAKRNPRLSYYNMATHGGLVSAPKLKLAIADAQSDDPRTVTLPNACPGSIVQLDDDTAYRAFSVSMTTPNTLPPDQWNMIKLPAEMPKAESADIEVNSEFIIVDKTLSKFIKVL